MNKVLANMIAWYQVGRHVRALHKSGIAAVDMKQMYRHIAIANDLMAWAEKSGALNDGMTPNHTKKRISYFATEVVESIPPRIWNGE